MRRHGRRFLACVVAAILMFPATTAAQGQQPSFRFPTDDELTKTKVAGKDWITYGGSFTNGRYSTLDQVNTSNVQDLKGAWLARLKSGRGGKYIFEADPLVVKGLELMPQAKALAENAKKIVAEHNAAPALNR